MNGHKYQFYEIPGEYIHFTHKDVEPIIGWEPPKKFPNCCPFHKGIVNNAESFLEKFPLCCEFHQKFAHRFKLTGKDFSYLKTKLVNQVSYTEHFIETRFENEDFFQDFNEYIEYNIWSFGQPPVGAEIYLYQVEHSIKHTEFNIPEATRKYLLKILEAWLKPIDKGNKSASLNQLSQIYNRWLKTFPFELEYFNTNKEKFCTELPFIAKIHKTNRYTGLAAATTHSESSMIQYLMQLTSKLLNSINTVELVRTGKIKNTEKSRLDLVLEQREVKRKDLLEAYSNNERKYIKTIKQWLNDEIELFNHLKSIDKKVLPKPKSDKPSNKRLSFKIQKNKKDDIKKALLELQRELYLVDEEKSSFEDLWEVLCSASIDKSKKILFGCYTNQLVYIIDKLKPKSCFGAMSYANIEKAGVFYSKEETKISAQLLSSSKNQTPNPDRQDFIDEVFNIFLKIH